MALTTEQEEKVKRIIEAFDNGKRLSDLPTIKGSNPFDLMVEVLDTDGESKKSTIAAMLPYAEQTCMYGVEFDTSVSSSDVTRIGNSDLHKSLPIQNRMRGCLLNDNGEVVEYLNPSDWRGNVRDGSRGQVMVELPLFYAKFETDGTKRRVKMSEYPLPGYMVFPKRYVSAYQATVQRSKTMLASVANNTEDYRGGNNNATWDGEDRSLLGMPASSINRMNFRNYARKRKAGSAEWNCMVYDIQKELYWLFVVEYATLHSQKAFNAQLSAEGFRQGGLGAGVSNLNGTKWNEWNAYNPFIPCGYTDELGNATGVKEFIMPEGYNNGEGLVVSVPRYHGIENPFAHLYQWTDGVNVRINPTEENGGNGLSEVFVCDDPSLFSDNGYEGYHHVGNLPRTEGWMKEAVFGEEGDIVPAMVGGGSTTYHCDYFYTNIPTTTTLRGLLFGGGASYGARCGFACASSLYAPTHASAHIGSRLCFLPQS